jgi:hypothetical protein
LICSSERFQTLANPLNWRLRHPYLNRNGILDLS